MPRSKLEIGTCPDCGAEDVAITSKGVCRVCRARLNRVLRAGQPYTPYKDLPEDKKKLINNMRQGHAEAFARKQEEKANILVEKTEVKVDDNYYQVKADQSPATTVELHKTYVNDKEGFIELLLENDCVLTKEDLEKSMTTLIAVNELKDLIKTLSNNKITSKLVSDLETSLETIEKTLQTNWEANGFQPEDDKKFKGFITWRNTLKSVIEFWKILTSSDMLSELQKATSNKFTFVKTSDDDNTMKKYQVTTETYSTIYNTRRPFTRVFYATSKENAYIAFTHWIADRQLHENKSKTVITELNN